MFRKSVVALIVLLSGATAGAATAQQVMTAGSVPISPAGAPDSTHKRGLYAPYKAAAKPTWSKEQIKAAQVGLAKTKLYKGDTSGVMDSATHKALRLYQKQNHLPVTGRLSDSTLTKLRAS